MLCNPVGAVEIVTVPVRGKLVVALCCLAAGSRGASIFGDGSGGSFAPTFGDVGGRWAIGGGGGVGVVSV